MNLPALVNSLEMLINRQADTSPVAAHSADILKEISNYRATGDDGLFGVQVAGFKNALSFDMGRNPEDRGLRATVDLLRQLQDNIQAITNCYDY